MFPRLALLPLGLFIIWCFVCQRWYVCHIKMACGTEQNEPPPPPPEEDLRPLVFKWSSETPIIRDGFDAIKQGHIDSLGEGQLLEIIGSYFEGEAPPEGFANMGLARAAQLKALFSPPIDASRIVESSYAFGTAPDGIQGDTLFEAASISYKTPPPPEEDDIVECIQGSNNSLTVLFPYGKANRETDAQIEKCLEEIVAHLMKTEDTAMIVGHTDDSGSEEFNMNLGRARAEHLKKILDKKGVDRSRIAIDSKGESQPVANNATEEGARQNRRAVLTLVEKN